MYPRDAGGCSGAEAVDGVTVFHLEALWDVLDAVDFRAEHTDLGEGEGILKSKRKQGAKSND